MILYKYFSPERLNIFENNYLRFTQPGSSNDPFETLPFIDTIAAKPHIDNVIDNFFTLGLSNQTLFNQEYEKILQDTIKEYNLPQELVDQIRQLPESEVISNAMGLVTPYMQELLGLTSPNLKDKAPYIIKEKLNSLFGILCLTEKPDNILMWAHYATCHNGFVIGFDITHPYFNFNIETQNQINKLKKVSYSIKRPEIIFFDPNEDEQSQLTNIANNFFFTKSDHWHYEKEWRMIRKLEDAEKVIVNGNEKICLFSFPALIVKSVIIGSQMCDADKQKIISLIYENESYRHTVICQATMDLKEFKLNIDLI